MRSGSDDDVKRVESVCKNGRMLERRSGGRLAEGDFVARLERVARDNRVTFSLREDLRISVIGGIMSYLLKYYFCKFSYGSYEFCRQWV